MSMYQMISMDDFGVGLKTQTKYIYKASLNNYTLKHNKLHSLSHKWAQILTNDGSRLSNIDIMLFTIDQYIQLCKVAVLHNGFALKYVKYELLTSADYFKICKKAVKKFGYALKYVDGAYLLDDMYYLLCCHAIEQDWRALACVRSNQLTKEHFIDICMKTMNINHNAEQYISDDIKDELENIDTMMIEI